MDGCFKFMRTKSKPYNIYSGRDDIVCDDIQLKQTITQI